MNKKIIITCLAFAPFWLMAQFHTMKMPKASPEVTETQTLGVTDITVSYHSPAVKGRDIWERVVPKSGNPIPWRAGANMNTTIAFTTAVQINGNTLEAGSYGFHTIPTDNTWTLIFAHHDNQWGSYYLNREKDVALEITVTPEETTHSEQLDYEFINRTDSSVVVALEWGTKRVPFEVSVDLNPTVIARMRYDLRGINTYRWQAWNDAANWCLNRNTNLDEALEWANRSINGGYGGFAANKNFSNLSTKGNILWALGKKNESDAIFQSAIDLMANADEGYGVGRSLLESGRITLSLEVFKKAAEKFADTWYVHLGYARALYQASNSKKAIKTMQAALNAAPEHYKEYVSGLVEKMKKGENL